MDLLNGIGLNGGMLGIIGDGLLLGLGNSGIDGLIGIGMLGLIDGIIGLMGDVSSNQRCRRCILYAVCTRPIQGDRAAWPHLR